MKKRRKEKGGLLGSWRLLFYKRKFVGDKNLEFDGSRRVISAQSSFIGLQILIEDVILSSPYLSMALLLPIKTSLRSMRCNSMSRCSLNNLIEGLGWITLFLTCWKRVRLIG
jgi:hypothetical protein